LKRSESKGGGILSYYSQTKEISGYQDLIKEDHGEFKYLAFGRISLSKGQYYSSSTRNYEVALVILSGKVMIGCEKEEWSDLGERKNVFEGKATTVYVPCQSEYRVMAQSDHVEIAVCKVKAEEKFPPFIVRPNDMIAHPRGKETWQREVNDIIGDNGDGRVHRIIVGESYLQAGHWSSYPPHRFYSEEPNLEALFHYHFNPSQGFGVQLVYTEDQSIDEAYIVRSGDTVAINKGFHPLSAAGGYTIYYLWVMARESSRILEPYYDPKHTWLNL